MLEKQTLLSLNGLKFPSMRFSSGGEFACVASLEKYVPGWKAILGETFQIPVGLKTIDFRVNGVFVEYHPIRADSEVLDPVSYYRLHSLCSSLERWQRLEIKECLEGELLAQYTKRRRLLLDMSGFKTSHLIVCVNEYDFYKRVICRFAEKVPAERKFFEEFFSFLNDSKRGR